MGLTAAANRIRNRADLLDAINVFPVADGDTGLNLKMTISPLEQCEDRSWEEVQRSLLLSARGNSGNILSSFVCGFLDAMLVERIEPDEAIRRGRDQAYGAVTMPVDGTILSVMDDLCAGTRFSEALLDPEACPRLFDSMKAAIRRTPASLPVLREAGVVDSGALGLLFFMEGFVYGIHGLPVTIDDREWQALRIRREWLDEQDASDEEQYCLDIILKTSSADAWSRDALEKMGSSIEVVVDQDLVKVHIHTNDPQAVREWAASIGEEVSCHRDDLLEQRTAFLRLHGTDSSQVANRWQTPDTPVHILTDAAGSLTRQTARELGVSLHSSYVSLGDNLIPECDVDPVDLYRRLEEDQERIHTSQAARTEVRDRLGKLCRQHQAVLYLTVGHQYTGNFDVASQFKKENDPEDRLRVLDSLAASGQLALVARTCAEFASTRPDPEELLDYARTKIGTCREYVFLDTLKYLARSGRMSRIGAFFGDAFKVKPVIVHRPDGAGKTAVVRSRESGLAFAVDRAREYFGEPGGKPRMLLQFTDKPTHNWVVGTAAKALHVAVPDAEQIFTPMSCTSGAHMGPGAWAVAFINA